MHFIQLGIQNIQVMFFRKDECMWWRICNDNPSLTGEHSKLGIRTIHVPTNFQVMNISLWHFKKLMDIYIRLELHLSLSIRKKFPIFSLHYKIVRINHSSNKSLIWKRSTFLPLLNNNLIITEPSNKVLAISDFFSSLSSRLKLVVFHTDDCAAPTIVATVLVKRDANLVHTILFWWKFDQHSNRPLFFSSFLWQILLWCSDGPRVVKLVTSFNCIRILSTYSHTH